MLAPQARTPRLALVLGTLALAAVMWSPISPASAARTSAEFTSDWVMEDGVSRLDTGEIWQISKNANELRNGKHVSTKDGLTYTGSRSGWTWFPVGKVKKVRAKYSLQPPLQPRAWPQWPWTVHSIYWLAIHPVQTETIKSLLYSPPWMFVRAGPTLLDVGIIFPRRRFKILYRIDFEYPFLPFGTPLRAGLKRVGPDAVRVTVPNYPHVLVNGSGPVVRHPSISEIFTNRMSVQWDFDQPTLTWSSDAHPILHKIRAKHKLSG